MTHTTDRLPRNWRQQPTHILQNWLDFSVDDGDEYDDVLAELNERAHTDEVRQINGGILP